MFDSVIVRRAERGLIGEHARSRTEGYRIWSIVASQNWPVCVECSRASVIALRAARYCNPYLRRSIGLWR
jgi:hypothetical protein